MAPHGWKRVDGSYYPPEMVEEVRELYNTLAPGGQANRSASPAPKVKARPVPSRTTAVPAASGPAPRALQAEGHQLVAPWQLQHQMQMYPMALHQGFAPHPAPKTPPTKRQPRRNKCRCWSRLQGSGCCASILRMLAVLLAAMGAVSPCRFPLLGKGVAAAAAFAEEVGGAAGVTAQAGANITAATTAVLVAIADGSIATVTSICTGVDLINVTVLAEDGAVTVDDGNKAAPFLESPDGVRWVSAPLAIRQKLLLTSKACPPMSHQAFCTAHGSTHLDNSAK